MPILIIYFSIQPEDPDIASAYAEGPVLYQLGDESIRIDEVYFNPPFKDNLYFLHLGKKQDSSLAVAEYKTKSKAQPSLLDQVSKITEAMVSCKKASEFQLLIEAHEDLIGKHIDRAPIKHSLFPDFKGSIKSLGAWGGDFALVCSEAPATQVKSYFAEKGYSTLLPYTELVLNN